MREKGKISFYRVAQCGFFKRGEDQAAFGSLSEMLHELHRWSQGKSLAATKTFEPADGQDLHPAYLLDIQQSNGMWLVSTWNQTPSTEAGVASVMANSNVGTPEVVMNDIEDGSIPGFATYFWFIPNRNLFASVRFQHLWTGQKSLQKYTESFLEKFSSHTVYGDSEDTDISIIGYVEHVGDDELLNVSPRFRTSLVHKPGQRELIRQNVDRIRKVVRKTTLQLNRGDELDQWQRFLRWTKINAPQQHPDKVRVQYEMNAQLSAVDINSIINDWDQGHEREWDDYGFVFQGEPETHWLSHCLARDEFELDIERDNPEVVSAPSLLQALCANSANILRILE